MAGWDTLARERADYLETELHRLGVFMTSEEQARLAAALDKVETDLGEPDGARQRNGKVSQRFGEWWSGNHVNETWYQLHKIETGIERAEPDTDQLINDAKGHVLRELPKDEYLEFTARLGAAVEEQKKRNLALDAIARAHLAAEAKHDGERRRQRGVLAISVGLLLVALVTFVLQMFSDDPFLAPPSGGIGISSVLFLGLVMFFGVIGGLVSALVSLYLADSKFTDTLWFDPRPMLTFAKAVMGIWTALIGLLAVGSGVLVGEYTSLASALLLAFVFGYGQQAITGFLDRKVADLATTKG